MKFHLFHLLLRHQMPDIIFRGILILCHRFVCNSTCSNANLASYTLRGSKNTPLHLEIKQKRVCEQLLAGFKKKTKHKQAVITIWSASTFSTFALQMGTLSKGQLSCDVVVTEWSNGAGNFLAPQYWMWSWCWGSQVRPIMNKIHLS